jgi:hypothetical membrane protein
MLAAGTVAPPLLALVVVLEDALTPGFDPLRHWVSHHSLGPGGWVNAVALAAFGVATLVFAAGVQRTAGRAWPLAVAGVGFLLAGVFPSDPAPDWPPGVVPAGQTAAGGLHDLGGLLAFGGVALGAWLLARSVPWSRAAALAIAVLFVAASALAVLSWSGALPGAPGGLVERLALAVLLAWMVWAARKLRDLRA